MYLNKTLFYHLKYENFNYIPKTSVSNIILFLHGAFWRYTVYQLIIGDR